MFDENENETTEVEVQYKPQEFCVVEADVESEDKSTNLDFQLFVCKFPNGSATVNYDCERRMITVKSSTLKV